MEFYKISPRPLSDKVEKQVSFHGIWNLPKSQGAPQELEVGLGHDGICNRNTVFSHKSLCCSRTSVHAHITRPHFYNRHTYHSLKVTNTRTQKSPRVRRPYGLFCFRRFATRRQSALTPNCLICRMKFPRLSKKQAQADEMQVRSVSAHERFDSLPTGKHKQTRWAQKVLTVVIFDSLPTGKYKQGLKVRQRFAKPLCAGCFDSLLTGNHRQTFLHSGGRRFEPCVSIPF